jgi:PAS domain S-box-containing protein
MTVGTKIFLIMTGAIVLFLGAAFLLVKTTLERSSDVQDAERSRESIARVGRELDNELRYLDRQTSDYSIWDDTYAFVQKPSEAYVKSNLVNTTFVENDFQVMIFLNEAGSVVYAEAFDAQAGRRGPIPAAFGPHLSPQSLLLDLPDPRNGRRGFLCLDEKIYLVAARPIVTSEGEGPIKGKLVVARLLDATHVRALGALVDLPVQILRSPGTDVPANVRAEMESEAEGLPTAVRIAGPSTITAYGSFRDIYGAPAFVVAFDRPRLVHAQYLKSMGTFLFILIAFGIISLFISQVVVSRLFMSRLRRLDGFVRTIGPGGRSAQRVAIAGRDEVSRLGEALNSLVEALEVQAEKSRRDEETIKKSQVKYQSLFETSTDAIFLETFDGQILDCNQAACDLLGYSKEEMLKLRVEDLLPDDIRAELPAFLRKLAEENHLVVEAANRKKTGELVPAEVSMRAVRIGDETLAVVYLHDLTARKRAESIQSAVYRISEAASSVRSLQDIFVLIHKTVTELIPTKNFSIALYDDETGLMSFPYFIDEHDEAPPPRRLRRGLTEYVLRTGAPLLAPRPVIEELQSRGEVELLGTMSFDWLGVPLRHEEKTIGVMAIQNYLPGRRFGEEEKNILMFVSSQAAMAIERVQAQERLQASLKEKEVLIREVHHRVKNNMQLISSLFNLQANELRDARALELLKECQGRIRSMALVHEKLYQSRDLARIHFSDYVQSLAIHLFHFWRVNPERIHLVLKMNPVFLDINTAIPCGLIINELVSNALEHAFPEEGSGEIRVRLEPRGDGLYALEVEDTGVGIPAAFDPLKAETLGLQIVQLLVEQLDGTIAFHREGGTRFAITFHELKLKARP